MWKRKSTELAYNWGTISMTNLDTPRIGYHGKIQKDAITGEFKVNSINYVSPLLTLCCPISR
jgi:hypothetical protein